MLQINYEKKSRCVVQMCARNYDGMQELRERGGSPKAIGAHLTPPFTSS